MQKAKKHKEKYKMDLFKCMKDKWIQSQMNGKFPNYLSNDHIDISQSFQWMKHTGLKGETEGFIKATQD